MNSERLHASGAIAGYLLFAMILMSIINGLSSSVSAFYAGILAWLAGLIMFRRFSPVLQMQIIAMIVIGLICIMSSTMNKGVSTAIIQAVSVNHHLIAMLAAVSFLRLITQARGEESEVLPNGRVGFIRTLLGVHFFSAIINMSSIVIVADRLSKKNALHLFQGVTLSRGFSLAALWSPFFAAMGVAITNAPGADIAELSLHGFPVAMVGLLASTLGFRAETEREGGTEGYPWNFKSLWLPAFLALAIIIAHSLFPLTSILTLIAIFSLCITAITLVLTHKNSAARYFNQYITNVFPRILGELTLFMAAGVLVVGITSLVESYQFNIHIMEFGATQASVLLIVILLLSLIGIHPLISISTASALLPISKIDPNLLAMTFLMGWGGGIVSSPLSAINLIMQGRYGLSIRQLISKNFTFLCVMVVIDIIAMHIYYR